MVKLAFDILDGDHDGRISQLDLNNFFISKKSINSGADFKTDNYLLNSLIDEADANRDGVIDFNEFNALMQKN
jgi:Ca2+-binding EF-hand superfamily protein